MRNSKMHVSISVEGKDISRFNHFEIEQRFNSHHTFSLSINYDAFGTMLGDFSLAESRSFAGKKLVAHYGHTPDMPQIFVGIITQIDLEQGHGHMGNVILSGYSPTILIDRGEDLGSYYQKTLASIVKEATGEVPPDDIKLQVNPERKNPLAYIIQYKESDFAFLKRLSQQYHEWFYYDGVHTHFGRPNNQPEVELIFGRDLDNLQQSVNVKPLKTNRFDYYAREDQMFHSQAKAPSMQDENLATAVKASNEVFSRVYNQPLNMRVDSMQEIDTLVASGQDSVVAGLVNITGVASNAGIQLGAIAHIGISKMNGNGYATNPLGSFIVTSVYHQFTGNYGYHNTFEGISSDAKRIPPAPFETPAANIQLAQVVYNDDPRGQGRVRVQFKWQCGVNDPTEWLRVMTPDAGSSVKVSKNRGFVFIPEVGDQVVVGFEDGNVAKPFVLGSVHNGTVASGGGANNITKSMTSRSGNKLELNDQDGSVYLTDQGGANMLFDGGGNATTNVNSDHTVNAGSNHTVNAGSTSTINVGGGKGAANSRLSMNNGGEITMESKANITFKTGDSSITLKSDGTILLQGKVIGVGADQGIGLSAKQGIDVSSPANHIGGGPTKIDGGDAFIN